MTSSNKSFIELLDMCAHPSSLSVLLVDSVSAVCLDCCFGVFSRTFDSAPCWGTILTACCMWRLYTAFISILTVALSDRIETERGRWAVNIRIIIIYVKL